LDKYSPRPGVETDPQLTTRFRSVSTIHRNRLIHAAFTFV
jgi:hypothetical protein